MTKQNDNDNGVPYDIRILSYKIAQPDPCVTVNVMLNVIMSAAIKFGSN